jgi:hypothetical protein
MLISYYRSYDFVSALESTHLIYASRHLRDHHRRRRAHR